MEYKGMTLNDEVGDFIRYMPQVDAYHDELIRLQAVWDNLTLLGQLSGVGNEMGNTRNAFFELSQGLMNHLGAEYLQRVKDVLRMKGTVAVEMMQRNLFERTADIGFLATDDRIRDYMQQIPSLMHRYGEDAKQKREYLNQEMLRHLHEYVAKYSVYNNVLLLSPEGQLLLALHPTAMQQSSDPLIKEALLTAEPYVEIFRPSDLLPQVAQAHIYAYRITDHADEPLGVLCLCFNFHDECERIFAELDDGDWSVMTLMDATGKIIASHDPIQVPLGVQMPLHPCGEVMVERFAGRRYLTVTCEGKGYQGYTGQGWLGHVMIPIEGAFETQAHQTTNLHDLHGLNIFSETLMHIPHAADQIQEGLNRSVWNGSVRQSRKESDSAFARALLWEVSQTGIKTKTVFSSAINDLYQTVLGATLDNNRFLASLAVNIMDRNLYERANDCRWWALTSAFRQGLSKDSLSTEAQNHLHQILSYINQLYTVYTGIVLYDAQGRVVAVSTDDLQSWVGRVLVEPWVSKSLALTHSQEYVISDFTATPLYHHKPTYVYAAAVMHCDDISQVVGGIGVIFDSEPQFKAMLSDSLPAGLGDSVFGIFYDEHQTLIATTRDDWRAGHSLVIDLQSIQRQGTGIINCHDGRYAVGIAEVSGYREYMGRHRVYGAIFCRVGGVTDKTHLTKPSAKALNDFGYSNEMIEVATFAVGGQLFGIRAEHVLEAVDVTTMIHIPVPDSFLHGYVKYHDKPVPVLDLSSYLASKLHCKTQAIIAEYDKMRFAILVDELVSIPRIPTDMIVPIELHKEDHLIDCLISRPSEKGSDLLMLISPRRIRTLMATGKVTLESPLPSTP